MRSASMKGLWYCNDTTPVPRRMWRVRCAAAAMNISGHAISSKPPEWRRPIPASREARGPRRRGNARHQLGRVAQCLQHDAIALGQLQEAVDTVLRLVGVEREGQADRTKADGRGAIDPQCAAEIEIAFGPDRTALQAEFERGRSEEHTSELQSHS